MEAVVAVGVFAVALTAVSYLTTVSSRTARSSFDITQASYLLHHRVDELITLGADFLATGPCGGPATTCAADRTTLAADGPCTQYSDEPLGLTDSAPFNNFWTFRVDTTTQPHPDPNNPNAVIATVSVCYKEEQLIREMRTRVVVNDR